MYGVPLPTCAFVCSVRLVSGLLVLDYSVFFNCHVASIQVIIILHYCDANVPCVLQDHHGHMQIHLFTWEQMFCQ